MTSGSAIFQETSADVGDTIHAEFTWVDAQWNIPGEFFCDMSIKDPNGEICDYYIEEDNSSGHVFLSSVTDMNGTWTATIKIWDGSNFLTYTDTIMVSLPGETSGSANFQETTATVGNTIHAEFTWSNAVEGVAGYAFMEIIDPNGTTKASWLELLSPNGSRTLSYTTDVIGIWVAEISIWTGITWLIFNDTIYVSEISDEVILTEAVTCEWVNGFEDHGPTVTEFALTDWVWAYLQVHSDADLYGKVMTREWWFKSVGESVFTKRSESTKTCTSHYNNWATWPTEDMGNQYGPGWGYIAVLVDGVFLGTTNQYVIGDPSEVADMRIEPSSEFFTGPFVESTIQLVCNVHVKNYGDVVSSVQLELWEYPGATNQNRVAYWSIPSVAPGETIIRGFDAEIPPGISWPLGVKVWGAGETEPSF